MAIRGVIFAATGVERPLSLSKKTTKKFNYVVIFPSYTIHVWRKICKQIYRCDGFSCNSSRIWSSYPESPLVPAAAPLKSPRTCPGTEQNHRRYRDYNKKSWRVEKTAKFLAVDCPKIGIISTWRVVDRHSPTNFSAIKRKCRHPTKGQRWHWRGVRRWFWAELEWLLVWCLFVWVPAGEIRKSIHHPGEDVFWLRELARV